VGIEVEALRILGGRPEFSDRAHIRRGLEILRADEPVFAVEVIELHTVQAGEVQAQRAAAADDLDEGAVLRAAMQAGDLQRADCAAAQTQLAQSPIVHIYTLHAAAAGLGWALGNEGARLALHPRRVAKQKTEQVDQMDAEVGQRTPAGHGTAHAPGDGQRGIAEGAVMHVGAEVKGLADAAIRNESLHVPDGGNIAAVESGVGDKAAGAGAGGNGASIRQGAAERFFTADVLLAAEGFQNLLAVVEVGRTDIHRIQRLRIEFVNAGSDQVNAEGMDKVQVLGGVIAQHGAQAGAHGGARKSERDAMVGGGVHLADPAKADQTNVEHGRGWRIDFIFRHWAIIKRVICD